MSRLVSKKVQARHGRCCTTPGRRGREAPSSGGSEQPPSLNCCKRWRCRRHHLATSLAPLQIQIQCFIFKLYSPPLKRLGCFCRHFFVWLVFLFFTMSAVYNSSNKNGLFKPDFFKAGTTFLHRNSCLIPVILVSHQSLTLLSTLQSMSKANTRVRRVSSYWRCLLVSLLTAGLLPLYIPLQSEVQITDPSRGSSCETYHCLHSAKH